MSASSQLINSMFEVRSICTCTQFEPIEQRESEISPVELVAELVEIKLEELLFYVMVRVKYTPFGVADGNVHPWEHFSDFALVVHDLRGATGEVPVLFPLVESRGSVCHHLYIPVCVFFHFLFFRGSFEVIDDFHPEMPHTLCNGTFPTRILRGFGAFRHYQDGSLPLASPSPLQASRDSLSAARVFQSKRIPRPSPLRL